jgi:hypothetical protein
VLSGDRRRAVALRAFLRSSAFSTTPGAPRAHRRDDRVGAPFRRRGDIACATPRSSRIAARVRESHAIPGKNAISVFRAARVARAGVRARRPTRRAAAAASAGGLKIFLQDG